MRGYPVSLESCSSSCLALGLSACADPDVGTKKRPFTMFFVPSVDAEGIAAKSKP